MSTGTVKQHVNEVIQMESMELGGTAVTASASEINDACDAKGAFLALTASAAIAPGVSHVTLDHTSTTIAATIADFGKHEGIFIVYALTEPGGSGDHTLTLASGTFDGTNDIATFADINDLLMVQVMSNGTGYVITNTGSVALSAT